MTNLNYNKQSAYNYPNPITSGNTTFRFFVDSPASKIVIRIYDAAGFLVDKLYADNLIPNTYNEITWNTNNLDSGLYFAELISDKKESKLIKIVIL